MPPLVTKRRLLIAAACIVVTAAVSGCGGAEARKARHLAKGQAFLQDGSFEKARVEFRNALQIAPNDSEARYENGIVDEKLGNPREAAQFYQGAIDSNPDSIPARVNLGKLFLFSGAPDRALETIKPSIDQHPEDAGLLMVRAAARIQLKETDSALRDAQRAVELAPNSEDAVAVLAGIYTSMHRKDEARTLLQTAIKNIPSTVDLRLALAQLYEGEAQNEQVEALLIELTHLKPNDKAHRLRLAQYYARLNHPDDAERVLREAVKALPNEPMLKGQLVQFLAARRGRDAAEKELTVLVAANPKDYDVRFTQAEFYEQDKDLGKAKLVYQKIIADDGLDAAGITARTHLARLLLLSNDTPGAEVLIAQVLGKNPRDNDALIMRGNMELLHQDPKGAIADLRSVLRDQPNAVGIMRSLARAHLANGEPALAEETMRRAVDANPKDFAARLDLAQLLLNVGKPDQAKPVIDELVKQEPSNPQALDTQFHVAVAASDTSAAKSAADALVATQPKAAVGYYYEASIAESEKRRDDAVRLYGRALELQPEWAEPLNGLARVLASLDRLPEALKRLDDIAVRYPKLPYATNTKGELLLVTHRTAEAEDAFRTAIDRDPTWWNPYRNLALAQRSTKDVPAAIAILQSGISKAKQVDGLQSELADLFEQVGKPDDAIQVYEAALRRDPHSDIASNNLAMLLVTYKKDAASLDRAKELSRRFSTSTNPSYLDTYGWVLYKRGESVAALSALQTAVAKTSDLAVPLYHLGMAQATAGQPEAARDSLSRSLKSGKTFSGMDEAKATLDALAKLSSASNAPRS